MLLLTYNLGSQWLVGVFLCSFPRFEQMLKYLTPLCITASFLGSGLGSPSETLEDPRGPVVHTTQTSPACVELTERGCWRWQLLLLGTLIRYFGFQREFETKTKLIRNWQKVSIFKAAKKQLMFGFKTVFQKVIKGVISQKSHDRWPLSWMGM